MKPFFLVVFMLTGTACVRESERKMQTPVPRIDRLYPDKIVAAQPFNVQANGLSALAATGAGFASGSRLLINGHPLATSLTDPATVSALVPKELFAKEGVYAITVDLPDGRVSNALPFVVLPNTGPPPVLAKLYPESTPAGVGFNVQANGESAMGLTGANFIPGVRVLLDGEPQETNFGDIDKLSCFFPKKFLARPGKVKVTVRNPDGKESPPVEFNVTAK